MTKAANATRETLERKLAARDELARFHMKRAAAELRQACALARELDLMPMRRVAR